MSSSVRVPTILRTYTAGASEVTAEGATLKEVLDSLDESFPGIKGRIVDEQGGLRRFVNVYVGNDDVRFLDGLDTPVSEGSQVSVIPAVAGGGWSPATASGWDAANRVPAKTSSHPRG